MRPILQEKPVRSTYNSLIKQMTYMLQLNWGTMKALARGAERMEVNHEFTGNRKQEMR